MNTYLNNDIAKIKNAGKPINEIKFQFPALSVNESMARSAVAAFCSQLDPSAIEIADVKCAVSEAVTNAIVHGYRDTVGQIYIKVKIFDNDVVSVEIKDKGCGIENVGLAMEPLFTTDAENERSGMGFTVMQSFCDRVRVRSTPQKGTTVTLIKVFAGK